MSDQPSSYAEALQHARDELARVRTERLKIDKRIARLELFIKSVSSLLDEPAAIDPKMGLTEGIKAFLQSVAPGGGMRPTTLRVKLQDAGFQLTGNNPLASIHAVCKRLVKQGVVQRSVIRGQASYFWITPDDDAFEEAVKEASLQSGPFPEAEDALKDL